MEKKQRRIAIGVIVFLCLFLYGNTLDNDYSLDDEYVIVNNPLVQRGVKALPKIFVSPYVQRENLETHSYRPVTIASFAIEYQMFEANPKMSHLINLILYAITCVVLFKLLLRLFKDYHWSLALLTTLLFLILPVHSEVVNNVKSRDEILCLLFALMSLSQFVKYTDTKRWKSLILGVVFILLSLMSKMSSLTFIAIIPLTLWFFTEMKLKKVLFILGALILAFVLIRGFAGSILNNVGEAREDLFYENPMYVNSMGLIGKIPMAFFTIGYYLKLMVMPVTLTCYYGYNAVPIVGWGNPMFWLSAVVILAGTAYALYKIKTKSPWVYGVLYFLIAISMFSNFLRPAVGIIAERFVYLPSLGFCIVVAFLIVKLFKISSVSGKLSISHRPVLLGLLALILVSATGRVVTRNKDWKDKMTLLQHDVQHAPKSAKLNSMIANELYYKIGLEQNVQVRQQMTDDAIRYYQQCVEVYPEYVTSWNNMGTLYFNEKRDFKKAKECYLKAIELKPEYPTALFSLGYCYELEKDYVNAIKYFELTLKLEPENKRAIQHIEDVKKAMQ